MPFGWVRSSPKLTPKRIKTPVAKSPMPFGWVRSSPGGHALVASAVFPVSNAFRLGPFFTIGIYTENEGDLATSPMPFGWVRSSPQPVLAYFELAANVSNAFRLGPFFTSRVSGMPGTLCASLQCLSAGSVLHLWATMSPLCGNSSSPMPFGWVRSSPFLPLPQVGFGSLVSNAFRLGPFFTLRQPGSHLGWHGPSPMPFGWVRSSPKFIGCELKPSYYSLQCLSAGSVLHLRVSLSPRWRIGWRSPMPFGWVRSSPSMLARIQSLPRPVSNAFRLGPFFTLVGPALHSRRPPRSPMPFGWVRSSPLPDDPSPIAPEIKSPMPFGWVRSSPTWLEAPGATLPIVSPMPFGWVRSSPPHKILIPAEAVESPMPFGWVRSSPKVLRRHHLRPAAEVSNAFRLGPFFTRTAFPKSPTLTKSPMPFGWVRSSPPFPPIFGPPCTTGLQCLSAGSVLHLSTCP